MESETTGCCLDVEPLQESAEELNAGVGKLPALELRRSSCNCEGRSSGQTIEMEPQAADQQEPQAVDQQARKIKAILEAVDDYECFVYQGSDYRGIFGCRRIVLEHASKLIQELDEGSEDRRKLQEIVDNKLSELWTPEPEKVDRDLQVILRFYEGYRERFHIDLIESRLRKQEGSSDHLPDRDSNGQVPENWTEALQFADILKEIIDAMSGGVQPEAVSGLQRTDEGRTMEVNRVVDTSSLLILLKCFFHTIIPWGNMKEKSLNYFINNFVKDLQASPTTIDIVRIQGLWVLQAWGKSYLYPRLVQEGLQKVGTVLHWAIELQDVKMVTQILEAKVTDVNAVNWMKGTPLHMAVLKGNIEIVRKLLKCEETIRLTEEDEAGRTPIEIAHTMGHTDIVRTLMEQKTVSLYVEALYRDRQVYVDAANAILVGAALIASVTFASWLQPPMGYTLAGGHVDVEDNRGLRAFWVFNALSFYFAIGTVVFGALSVLPKQHVFIRKNVEELRRNLLVTSILLACSVSFVIVAFAIAGSIVLMPVLKVQWTIIGPVIIGGFVCAISLVLLIKNIWNESFGTRTVTSDQYLLPKEPSRVGKLLRGLLRGFPH